MALTVLCVPHSLDKRTDLDARPMAMRYASTNPTPYLDEGSEFIVQG